MKYIIKLPPHSASYWRWEAYKVTAAMKGLVTDVTPAIIGRRKRVVGQPEFVAEVLA